MRKKYVTPLTEVIRVEPSRIIASSPLKPDSGEKIDHSDIGIGVMDEKQTLFILGDTEDDGNWAKGYSAWDED